MKDLLMILIGEVEKKFSINFSKEKPKFCFGLHYSGDNSYFFTNEKKSLSLTQIMKTSTFLIKFV